MIRKLKSGEYRLLSARKDSKAGQRRNLGTFTTLEAARRHVREVRFYEQRWLAG